MKEYNFEIYYEYTVNTPADFFEGEKSSEEVQNALANFENEIHYSLDSKMTISSSMPQNGDKERRIVSIKTDANESKVIDAVEKCLKSLYLKGKKLW